MNVRPHHWSVVVVVPRAAQYAVIARGFNTRDINFPGGYKDPEDATPADTAARELYEETGLMTTAEFLKLIDTWKGAQNEPVYAYLATGYRGRMRSSGEGKPFWTANISSLVKRTSTFRQDNARLLRKMLEMGRAELDLNDGHLQLRPRVG
jgi:ADP-ribose pyrophosphatase YjhB (NUDIX family)